VPDLQRVLPYDNPFDDQLQDRLLFLKGRLVQPPANPLTERPHIAQVLLGVGCLPPELALLLLLGNQPLPPLRQVLPPLTQFR